MTCKTRTDSSCKQNCRGCREGSKKTGCLHCLCQKATQGKFFFLPTCFPTCWSYRLSVTKNGKIRPFVVTARGQVLQTSPALINALLECGHTALQTRECLHSLYTVEFGISWNSKKLTDDIEKNWYQQCLGPNGLPEIITGLVFDYRIICNPNHQREFFLRFDDDDSMEMWSCRAKEYHHLSEEEAMVGIRLFQDKNVDKKTNVGWIVPMDYLRKTVDGNPVITFSIGNFNFLLTREISTIPNAGNGLFLTVTTTTPGTMVFELESGRLIDFGVYGPTTKEELMDETTMTIKNFLYDKMPGIYAFQSRYKGYIIDIIDDATGEINHQAQSSLLVYANEIDGIETPDLQVKYDAHGAVHFLLGSNRKNKRVIIPINKKYELKVGYLAC